jgi:N-acetylmuramic acid 6-phosphate etherase
MEKVSDVLPGLNKLYRKCYYKTMLTERLNPSARDIDALEVEGIVGLMSMEDSKVVAAVWAAAPQICQAARDAVAALRAGGSLIYVGAGTSGRLGVLDASEMPPTFNVPPHMVRGIIAGGAPALTRSIEGAEDDEEEGRRAVGNVSARDMLLGISASGKTPFVISALREGKARGAICRLITCNETAWDFLDGVITVPVGPEIVAGSSRLKAGTATKMILNMISTSAMIKLGRVFKGWMVDVVPTNTKLRMRALGIIRDVTGCTSHEAVQLLEDSGGNAKTAILMHLKGILKDEAQTRLEKAEGSLRQALAGGNP